MSLLIFFIVTAIIVAILYVFNYVLAPPRPVKVIITIVAIFVELFLVLALFKLMPLPFDLT